MGDPRYGFLVNSLRLCSAPPPPSSSLLLRHRPRLQSSSRTWPVSAFRYLSLTPLPLWKFFYSLWCRVAPRLFSSLFFAESLSHPAVLDPEWRFPRDCQANMCQHRIPIRDLEWNPHSTDELFHRWAIKPVHDLAQSSGCSRQAIRQPTSACDKIAYNSITQRITFLLQIRHQPLSLDLEVTAVCYSCNHQLWARVPEWEQHRWGTATVLMWDTRLLWPLVRTLALGGWAECRKCEGRLEKRGDCVETMSILWLTPQRLRKEILHHPFK